MTIKDLARLSGYSIGTVSRALNHQPDVSPKARDRILSLASQYGYEINGSAQSLKQQNSSTLLVIVKGRANVLFSRAVEEIQRLAAQADQPLLVDYIDEDDNEVRRAVQLCREKKPQGILFLGGVRRHFEADFGKVTIPAVVVTNYVGEDFPNLSSVTMDDTAAAFAAVAHLTRSGHRKIAVIGGDPEKSGISRKRLSGCAQAMEASGAELFRYANARFSCQGGYDAMESILTKGRPTAVFAMSDVMAIGAMRCIFDHGLRVPEDICVVGFDGLALGQFCVPRLTTVVQNIEDITCTAYQLLQSTLTGSPAAHITVPFTLEPGESVRSLDG